MADVQSEVAFVELVEGSVDLAGIPAGGALQTRSAIISETETAGQMCPHDIPRQRRNDGEQISRVAPGDGLFDPSHQWEVKEPQFDLRLGGTGPPLSVDRADLVVIDHAGGVVSFCLVHLTRVAQALREECAGAGAGDKRPVDVEENDARGTHASLPARSIPDALSPWNAVVLTSAQASNARRAILRLSRALFQHDT